MIENKELFTTADGSKTFFLPELNEYYHSHHGAIQEARHVFLKNGLAEKSAQKQLSILEVGFGTGLNAFLTAIEAANKQLEINYTGLEAFPLTSQEAQEMAYTSNPDLELFDDLFSEIHATNWGEFSQINSNFKLKKIKETLQQTSFENESFDLVYFDAFGPRVQPELWTEALFAKIYAALKPGGILVTYCAKGQVKRDLKSAGFNVETLDGPPGKREMIRAGK
ncbi:MAG: hypothetical protein K0R65_1885 [Crocinitomicaceae bacterium]|jgi:tRNA U34 5-methylaminomethyl-2-thiouridine-forming methyltransferase MnmC|nr:hypothetical protein [Crocinitomicaceae bacterium]